MPSYLEFQIIQMGIVAALGIATAIVLWVRRISLASAPTLWVFLGYSLACSLSNSFRSVLSDFTAEDKLTAEAYGKAAVWWCASITLFSLAYMLSMRQRPRSSGVSDRLVIRIAYPWYLVSFALVIICYVINPYRGKDFGVLHPADAFDLERGGLLVSGLLALLASGIAIPLAGASILPALCAIGISLILLLGTGSKAIASVYLVVVALQIFRLRTGSWNLLAGTPLQLLKRFALACVLMSVCFLLVIVSVRKRYDHGQVDPQAAVATTLARFTHQDIASIIYGDIQWRESFRPRYIKDTVLSFIPGFIWPEKPLNPAYEINELMGEGYTAASPSFFGAMIIAAGDRIYWIGVMSAGLIIGLLDSYILRIRAMDTSGHLYWYLFFTAAMLFEANFVLYGVQLLALLIWRFFLVKPSVVAQASPLSSLA